MANYERVTITMPPHLIAALKVAATCGFHKMSFSAAVSAACEETMQKHGYLPKEEIEVLTNP